MMRTLPALVTGLLLLGSALAAPTPAAVKPPAYHLEKSFPLGGEGSWDYVTFDGASQRLFISRSSRVAVVDAGSGKQVGEIQGTEGVHGIALAPELGRGFTSNGRSGSVTVFDLKTLAVLGTVKTTGDNPDAILYDPATRRVFTFNGRSANATAIDAATSAVVGTIALGGKPEYAVSDGAGRVYVNLEDKNELLALDPKTLRVESRWPLTACEEPTGLALDARSRRLFAGCGNRLLAVVNANDGKVVKTLPIGKGTDAVTFDAVRNLVFSSNGDGTLTVIHEDSPDAFRVVENVTTKSGARTMALDEKTGRIFLPTARFGPRPPPTADQPRPRPVIEPGSFEILVVAPRLQ